jgi:hypothetical protein
LTIAYKTEQGASNRFEVDLVYALGTDSHEIASPVHPEVLIRSATIENIITDKVATCHRFGSGNSRMKDFDDLWRLSKSSSEIDPARLRKLLKTRNVEPTLDRGWITSEMELLWAAHRKRYPDLPERLEQVLLVVNDWISGLLKAQEHE